MQSILVFVLPILCILVIIKFNEASSLTIMQEVDNFVNSPSWNNFVANFRLDQNYESKLDSVALLCTQDQLLDGKVKTFFSGMSKPSHINARPAFWIFTPNPLNSEELRIIDSYFDEYNLRKEYATITFISMNFSNTSHDSQSIQSAISNSQYASSAIFSELYYYSLKYLSSRQQAVLLLDCDCKFQKEFWFDDLYWMSQVSSFWVIGSTYKGKANLPPLMMQYIGPVAIYKVNDASFQDYLQLMESFYRQVVVSRPWISADMVFCIFLSEFFGPTKDYFNNSIFNSIVRYVLTMHINTNTIINISTKLDKRISNIQISKRYPKACIVHQVFGSKKTDESPILTLMKTIAKDKELKS